MSNDGLVEQSVKLYNMPWKFFNVFYCIIMLSWLSSNT